MHTYTKQEHLNDIDTNDIGEHIDVAGYLIRMIKK
jgi:hypothetical protein